MSAAESVVSSIQHYQKSIEKYQGTPSRVLHCINRLYQLPVTVQHLQDTGVGKTINSLRKSDGDVGEAARALVLKWKQMVEDESENEPENSVSSHAYPSNGDSETENVGGRFYKRDKRNADKTLSDRKDLSKSLKRKKEPEYNEYKEKKVRSEDGLSTYSSVSYTERNTEGEDVCSDREWNANSNRNGNINSDDESNFKNGPSKAGRHTNLGHLLPLEDEMPTEHLVPSSDSRESSHKKEEDTRRQHKSSKKEKSSSHKHKSKSSSSSSDKSKHSSSSRVEHKESKSSSSSRHKDDKNVSGSSSSSKKVETSVTEKSEDKSKSKEKKEKHRNKHQSKEEKKSKDKKDKAKNEDEGGVDSFSGIGFGEALGMIFAPEKSKKKITSSTSFSASPSKKKMKVSSTPVDTKLQLNSSSEVRAQQRQAGQSSFSLNFDQSHEVDEDYGLPTLNPNYKPLPQPVFYNSPPKRYQTDEDDLTNIMYSKVQRTKVFSGNKTGYTYVPSLFELCTRVLQENIDALEYTGGVPFDLLKPVLERASADQLFTLEHYNAYLIEDTDIFWEFHCKKEFRNKNREEMETWREMYLRCMEERESKLKSLTANIAAASKAKALPVRKTQLAYIEGTVKPPRGIARKQARFGTAQMSSSSTSSKQDSSSLGSSFTGRASSLASTGPAVSVPPPRGASGGPSSHSSSCKPKPKAPLMQKALQLIKHNRFKR